MKRIYFLIAIAALQIVLGSLTLLGAAQPVRTSQDVFIATGSYYHFDFTLLGTGQLSGSLSELQARSVDVFIFDDRGYASFLDGSNTVPPLFEQSGTSVVIGLNLSGPAQYHVVVVDFPARQGREVRVDLLVVGLRTTETIVAVIVLVGGLALVGASLMLSVWSWRRAVPAPNPPPSPPSDPSPDPQEAIQDPPDDTRIY